MDQSSAGASHKEIADYYDNYKEHQKKLGINIRHRTILKNCKSAGLRPDSIVLEIGCGIGTVSHLLLGFLKSGNLTGVDISKQSIDLARKNHAAFKNSEFVVSDMSDFKSDKKFDFIVFPDVLEHIPENEHAALFATISRYCTQDATILINIPEPNFLNWIRKNDPAKLQIIDQSLSPKTLIDQLDVHGFKVYSVTPYSLNYKVNDYLSLVFKRKMEVLNVELKSFMERGIQNTLSKI